MDDPRKPDLSPTSPIRPGPFWAAVSALMALAAVGAALTTPRPDPKPIPTAQIAPPAPAPATPVPAAPGPVAEVEAPALPPTPLVSPGYPAAGRPVPAHRSRGAGFAERRPGTGGLHRLRGVHFFQDDWPYTFWDNLDLSTLDEDFAEIREWGFNTVVVFLSWGAFQTTHDPPVYNEGNFEKLEALVEAADRRGLWVIARVGTPEHLPEDFPGGSFQIGDLMYNRARLDAQAALFAEAAKRIEKYDNVYGMFTSWEDFSDYLRAIHASEEERREEEDGHGHFRAYLAARGPIEHWNRLWGTSYPSFDAVPVPANGTRALADYVDFVRDYISGTILPGIDVGDRIALGYESRLDKERTERDGQLDWHGYRGGSTPPNLGFLASYYNPYWETPNDGGFISPEVAAAKCARVHDLLQADDPALPVFVDQLNLADDTPAFTRTNTKIRYPWDEARAAELIVPDLFDRTIGYSLWTYRDYVSNVVRDGSFQAGNRLWKIGGPARRTAEGFRRAGIALAPGASATQALAAYLNPDGAGASLRFDVVARVEGGAGPQSLDVVVRAEGGAEVRRRIEVQGPDARLHGFTLEGLEGQRPASVSLETPAGNSEEVCLSRPRIWGHQMASGVVDLDGVPRHSRAMAYQKANRAWERFEEGLAVPARHPVASEGPVLGPGYPSDQAATLAALPLYLPFAGATTELVVHESGPVGRRLTARWAGEAGDPALETALVAGENRLEIRAPRGRLAGPGDRVLLVRVDGGPRDDREATLRVARVGSEPPALAIGEPARGRSMVRLPAPPGNRLIVAGKWVGKGSARVTFGLRGHPPVSEDLASADGDWCVVLPAWEDDFQGRPELFVEFEPLSGEGAPVVESITGEPERSPSLVIR